jgi:hypothetical protein
MTAALASVVVYKATGGLTVIRFTLMLGGLIVKAWGELVTTITF